MGNGNSNQKNKTASTPSLQTTGVTLSQSTPNLTLSVPSNRMTTATGGRRYVQIGKVKVTVIKGEFYKEQADVIVNSCPSDVDLSRSRGSEALSKEAGSSVQDELNNNYSDGIQNGDVAVTGPGKLACKKIYHVTFPRFQSGRNSMTGLKTAIKDCLEMADKNHCSSIVFPTMGTISLKYNTCDSAKAGFEAITEFSQNRTRSSTMTVTWAIFDNHAFKDYQNEARNASSQSGSAKTSNSMSLTIGHITVNVICGSIAHQKADIIVNSAPDDLNLSNGGLSEALLKAAGQGLQQECNTDYPDGLSEGEIAVTSGCNLPCKFVCHGCLPKWGTNDPDPIESLEGFMTGCLEEAQERNISTIAFPTLGTGSLNYPSNVCAKSMIKCLEDFVTEEPQSCVQKVTIVIYDKASGWQKVEQAFRKECNAKNPGSPPVVLQKPRISAGTSNNVTCVTFGNINVQVVLGEIVKQNAVVLVNSAPDDMNLKNGGLAESFLNAAGQELQDSCTGNYGNGLDYGTVAVTSGYKLSCKYVYHTCLPVYSTVSPDPQETLEETVSTCLIEADRHDTQSIAFPTLGTGSLQYPADVTARIMIDEIEHFSNSYPSSHLQSVTIVIYDQASTASSLQKAFKAVCQKRSVVPSAHVAASGPSTPPVNQKPALPNRGTQAFLKHKYSEKPRPPSNWTHFTDKQSLIDWSLQVQQGQDVQLVPVTQVERSAIEQLIKDTWMPQFIGAGNDAQGLGQLGYTNVRVTKIERIENPALFETYANSRAKLFLKASKSKPFVSLDNISMANGGPILTTKHSHRLLKQDIYPEINEHYCFHGTLPQKVAVIASQGLDLRLSSGAALGSGIYAAESATKSDQYADPKNQRDMKEKKMLLIRMCLGDHYVINKPQPFKRPPCVTCKSDTCSNHTHNGHFDSVVIDGHWNFREFVVYDAARVYPEYVISYQRC